MTRNEVKKLLPVLQAYAEGKRIEVLEYDGKWREVDYNVQFNRSTDSYRIYEECNNKNKSNNKKETAMKLELKITVTEESDTKISYAENGKNMDLNDDNNKVIAYLTLLTAKTMLKESFKKQNNI